MIGSPAEEELGFIQSEKARRYIRSLPRAERTELRRLWPHANPQVWGRGFKSGLSQWPLAAWALRVDLAPSCGACADHRHVSQRSLCKYVLYPVLHDGKSSCL